MAKKWYTAEEIANMITNEDDDRESLDSLDDSGASSNSDTSSQSEIDSDTDADYSYRKISYEKNYISSRGRPRGPRTRGGTRGRSMQRAGARVRGGSRSSVLTPRRPLSNESDFFSSTPIGASDPKRHCPTNISTPTENSQSDTQESVTGALGDDSSNAGNNIADSFDDQEDSQDELLLAGPSREIKWSSDDPVIEKYPFTENVGPLFQVPENAGPSDFMKLLLTEELITEIMNSTNAYADRVINSSRPLRR